mmetsp:Transcript_27549/g.50455  ORF Transcript_27549/g.50455 Transcript_27549/m.50455 type:complete len:392 (-) Transcript_27549:492-1667(-)
MKLPLLIDNLKLRTELLNALPSTWTKGLTLHEPAKDGKRAPSKPNRLRSAAQSQQDKPVASSADMLSAAFDERCAVEPWETANLEYVELLQNASRNHGSVDLMRRLDSGSMVAVKKMPNRWVTSGPREFREKYPTATERPWLDIGIVRYLNGVNFPYACQLHDVFRDATFTYVVASLATEGDLLTWCKKLPTPSMENEAVFQPIAGQIIEAVRVLHNLGISHRDLSMENILVTKGRGGLLHVQIIDFGMATTQRKCTKEVRGKQPYQAPEMHDDTTAYDPFLIDAFAVGVILFGLAAQDFPWITTQRGRCCMYDCISRKGLRNFLKHRKARTGDGACLIEVMSEDLIEVVEGLLQLQAERRLTLGEKRWGRERASVLDLPWVKGGALGLRL